MWVLSFLKHMYYIWTNMDFNHFSCGFVLGRISKSSKHLLFDTRAIMYVPQHQILNHKIDIKIVNRTQAKPCSYINVCPLLICRV